MKISSVTASSIYPTDGASYYPGNVLDGNKETAWFPSRTENVNLGEWIKLEFQKEEKIETIGIINGWVISDGLFQHNSRLRKATIEFSNGEKKAIQLKDNKETQNFNIGGINTKWVKIVISEIYQGRQWNQEAGITEVIVNNAQNHIDSSILTSPTNSNSSRDNVSDTPPQTTIEAIFDVIYRTSTLLYGELENNTSHSNDDVELSTAQYRCKFCCENKRGQCQSRIIMKKTPYINSSDARNYIRNRYESICREYSYSSEGDGSAVVSLPRCEINDLKSM